MMIPPRRTRLRRCLTRHPVRHRLFCSLLLLLLLLLPLLLPLLLLPLLLLPLPRLRWILMSCLP